jgi:hypothetical protein
MEEWLKEMFLNQAFHYSNFRYFWLQRCEAVPLVVIKTMFAAKRKDINGQENIGCR